MHIAAVGQSDLTTVLVVVGIIAVTLWIISYFRSAR